MYSDVFGGSSVQPADVGFRAVTLTASITTVWPPFATSDNELARIMKVSASSASLTITLPDATLVSAGMDCLFDNSGANTFTVLDSAGSTVATLTAGQVKYLYLSDNATAAGTWRVTLFGTGSSTLDASQLSGYGLKALNNTLNAAPVLTSISGDTTVTSTDRAKVFVWAGGAGTLTLPTTAGSTSDFHIEVRNQGTGALAISPVGGALIDDAATISLALNEACFVHMGSADWYTVGRGRNTAFNFTHLTKAVTGGSTTLSLTEASNVVQTYTGILTSNQIVTLPATVQVYYVTNSTTGAYTLTFKCITAGSASVAVTQGLSVILFCDGSTVINNSTSVVSGITSLVFAAGSAAVPSCAISTSDNGLYSPAGDQVGMAINGAAAGLWTASGYKTIGSAAQMLSAYSSGAGATQEVDRPAGFVGSVVFKTAGVDRWKWNADAVAEAGANAGSNLNLSSYDDAGSLLGTVMTVVRSTQIATFTQPLVTNITGYASSLKSATTTVAVSAATAPTVGQVLTATGASAATWQTPVDSAVFSTMVLLTSGTSWTCPAGVTNIVLTVVGAGGGGCSRAAPEFGAGGGGGATAKKLVSVTEGTSYSYAIGAGGAAGSSDGVTQGSAGGDSTFNTGVVTVTGGGGPGGNAYYGFYGGTATNGDLNIKGGASMATKGANVFAVGGASTVGQGGLSIGTSPPTYGGGGYGLTTGAPPQAGADGLIIIEY